jgi:hypothetical protein
MKPEPSPVALTTLLRELRDETTTLLRQEVALAKAELHQSGSQLTRNALKLAVGGSVAYAGLIVLLIGLGHLLGRWLVRLNVDAEVAEWLAPVILGFVVVSVGGLLVFQARNAIARGNLVPRRTLESLRTTKTWAETKLHPSS